MGGNRQSRPAAQTLPNAENEPKIPLTCQVYILRFVPTSQLVRFISNAPRHPLGKFWSQALKIVIEEERLPFRVSLAEGFVAWLSDRQRATIAKVRHPELFRFSPLCDLVERARFAGQIVLSSKTAKSPRFKGFFSRGGTRSDHGFVFEMCGADLLNQLPSLTSLDLDLSSPDPDSDEVPPLDGRTELSPKLLSQLESLAIEGWSREYDPAKDVELVTLLCGATRLKKLRISAQLFTAATPAFVPLPHPFMHHELANDASSVLSQLDSLCILRGEASIILPTPWIFLRNYMTSLRELALFTVGGMSVYFDAFRTMPNLTTLGLEIESFEIDEDEIEVTTVTDLRLSCIPSTDGDDLLIVLSKFPNLATLFLQSDTGIGPLFELASQACSRRILPALQRLSCEVLARVVLRDAALLAFLENPRLPGFVTVANHCADLASDPDCLSSIYRSMKAGSIHFLALKGPVEGGALTQLREAIKANGSDDTVSAWQDRSLGPQPSEPRFNSTFTDFEVRGMKIAGCAQGEPFTIRVYHALKRSPDIFEF